MENEIPHAYYSHSRQRWEMHIAETVVGETQQEAEDNAEARVALYHRAVEAANEQT